MRGGKAPTEGRRIFPCHIKERAWRYQSESEIPCRASKEKTIINEPPNISLMKTIILDTNFLMIPAQFKVDIFDEIKRIFTSGYEMRIMQGTTKELEYILKGNESKDRKAAKMALTLIRNYGLKPIPMQGMDVDAAILALPNKDLIVATQDAQLKRLLQEKGIPLLVLRKEKHLQLVE